VSIESKLKEIGMVGLVEVRKRNGRAIGFVELQEPSGGTQLAARCHTKGTCCSVHDKLCFSYFSHNRNRRVVV